MSTEVKKLTQHKIRQHAVQALFMLDVRPDKSPSQAITFVLSLDNVGPLPTKNEDFDNEIEDSEELTNPAFLSTLVLGTWSDLAEIDETIKSHLTADWSFGRLTVVDRAILRLGVYEILKTDVPPKVALDEALNLAHDFSDEAAVKLINGILTQLI